LPYAETGDVGGNAPGLVAGEQLGRRAAARFLLEIGEHLEHEHAGATATIASQKPLGIECYDVYSFAGLDRNGCTDLAAKVALVFCVSPRHVPRGYDLGI
jgi:hypothetical protein